MGVSKLYSSVKQRAEQISSVFTPLTVLQISIDTRFCGWGIGWKHTLLICENQRKLLGCCTCKSAASLPEIKLVLICLYFNRHRQKNVHRYLHWFWSQVNNLLRMKVRKHNFPKRWDYEQCAEVLLQRQILAPVLYNISGPSFFLRKKGPAHSVILTTRVYESW